MRLFRFASLISLLSPFVIVIRDAPIRIYEFALDFLASAFELFRPEPLAIGEGWADFVPAGAPLDLALQHGLRHEARVPKRSAARHI